MVFQTKYTSMYKKTYIHRFGINKHDFIMHYFGGPNTQSHCLRLNPHCFGLNMLENLKQALFSNKEV